MAAIHALNGPNARQDHGLGQSARRSSLMHKPLKKRNSSAFDDGLSTLSQNSRRSTIFAKPIKKPVLMPVHEDSVTEVVTLQPANRDSRRRTIWVPSDDTTVMTIHPGAHTHTLVDETIALAGTSILKQTTDFKTTHQRRSSLFQAPKRVPLSSVKRPSSNALLCDIAGCPTGKENHVAITTKQTPKFSISAQNQSNLLVRSVNHTRPKPWMQEKQTALQPVCNNISKPRSSLRSSALKQSRASEFPTLQEDLEHPELFEDGWLGHQETSLSQVINDILNQSDSALATSEPIAQRARLLTFYQQLGFVELRRRLVTSIQTGALSLPKASAIPRLQDDVGLRRSFIQFWLDAYDLRKLWAAAEVVSANVCKPPAQIGGDYNTKALRKTLGRFLISILVTCDNPAGSQLEAWQRTASRSLMIISLLDQGHKQGILHGPLFLKTSQYKTSTAVLRAMGSLALPFVGDITRTLGYLGYSVSYAQKPLQEVNYAVTNLATDLRDGVLLARLLEVLMYRGISNDTETITVTLPHGNSLESMLDSKVWPLSQHLRYPCPTRAQRLYNVQVSLSALEASKGLTQTAASTIQAADIVDGHRERTLSFLWAIISRWGLHMLIPTESLRAEIKRHTLHLSYEQAVNVGVSTDQPTNESASPDEVASLLKTWATVICADHNVTIDNFTTSFASPAALAAIIDTYAACIPNPSSTLHSQHAKVPTSHPSPLQARLRALGCSTAFVQLFANESHIPTKATTLCLLAFLASRLIPLSRRLRAAETLQRAWRARLTRVEMHKRVTALKVAHQCAAVVGARHRVEWAVVVLQRAWREMKAERMRRAERRIEGFQAAARGWATRRALAGVLPSLGRRRGERTRGGW